MATVYDPIDDGKNIPNNSKNWIEWIHCKAKCVVLVANHCIWSANAHFEQFAADKYTKIKIANSTEIKELVLCFRFSE